MTRVFRIGTRGSALAVRQTGMVVAALRRKFPKARFTVQEIKTRGDRDQTTNVFDHKQTGVFTREIEKHLLAGKIDIAVHSLKDLPTSLPRGLAIGAYFKREDPSDCLVTRGGKGLASLPKGARVGTTSIRRELQLLALRPDLRVEALRGNLTTRIDRVRTGALDAVIVAKAGIARLGRHGRLAKTFRAADMLPCVGQGILAVEIRSGDAGARRVTAAVDHKPSRHEGVAERALLAALHGGCRVPIGALARSRGGRVTLEAAVLSRKKLALKAGGSGPADKAESIGRSVARKLLAAGAKGYIVEARR